MVRLKVFYVYVSEKVCFWFQFQNGAIKSKYKLARQSLAQMFQFQNGAIKRNTGY